MIAKIFIFSKQMNEQKQKNITKSRKKTKREFPV